MQVSHLTKNASVTDIDWKAGVIKTVLSDPGAVFHFPSPEGRAVLIAPVVQLLTPPSGANAAKLDFLPREGKYNTPSSSVFPRS